MPSSSCKSTATDADALVLRDPISSHHPQIDLLSGFCIRSPDSRNLLPPSMHQVLPHPLCLLPADVLTGLQRGMRRT